MKGNTSATGAASTNGSGRFDAKLGTAHHVIIAMGSVDNGNILLLLLLLLVIWRKQSRRGMRFMNRQRNLRVKIGGNLVKRGSIPVWGMDRHVSEIGRYSRR